MATDSDVSVTYALSQPIDIPAALETLEPFGTETLPIDETRLIAIFQGAILDIESTNAPLDQTARLTISVFELPPETHHHDPDSAARALIEDCFEQLATTADVSVTVVSNSNTDSRSS